MPLKLYKMDLSPPARAAMMICEIHNLSVEMVNVDLLSQDHKMPEYLEKNPMHTVPVLEDDDFIVHDSHVILTYLTEQYGKDDSLYPKDPKKKAQVDQKLFLDTVLFSHLRSVINSIFYERSRKLSEKQINDLNESYGFLEAFLSKTKFVAADNMTVADVSILSTISALRYIVPIDESKYPKLRSWYSNMESQPFYKKAAEAGTIKMGELFQSRLDL